MSFNFRRKTVRKIQDNRPTAGDYYTHDSTRQLLSNIHYDIFYYGERFGGGGGGGDGRVPDWSYLGVPLNTRSTYGASYVRRTVYYTGPSNKT